MDEPCSRDDLRACLRDIARTNRWFGGYRPLLVWLETMALPMVRGPIRILDVGCGYGDGLRRIAEWASLRGIAVELTGLDLNPDTVAIAAEASPGMRKIEWVAADVFDYAPPRPVHIVVSSLFTHHLLEADVVRFIRWMEQHAAVGWFISDLSRSAVPYYLFRWFAKVARLHRFVQSDGPVSIARSFVPEDWKRMCAAAGQNENDIVIRKFTPARLCVERRKPQ
jgi:2-polyprenyl-3-methyl-5-hydroxy-6-metoxy-1,4-benzoquinol methylase